MAHKWVAIFSRTRSLFAIERLGADTPAPAVAPGRGLLRMLVAREPLPRDAEAPARRRRGGLRLLFAFEPLEHARAPATRRRAHWARWLFAVERLDRS